ncbi:MAG: endonuclease Q family protein [Candidatus Kerfeldbacteria bacterium]
MQIIADLHIHSHYSRATSKQLNVAGIAKYAAIKGVDVIATGDITHAKWLEEIEVDLEEDGSGFLRVKDGSSDVKFALFTEIANMYKKNDKGRRLHTVIGVSSLAAAKKANAELEKRGYNLKSDGRPIIGGDVRELMKIYLDADPKALIIPAHIWTPWFSVFGSKSGFDSLEECYEEMTEHIYAIETGLSSDPAMNWRVSDLNNRTIVSNSDAHSPDKIGREANVFEWDNVTYDALYESLKKNENMKYTIEFYPEEGKYHLDGHRACEVRLEPAETKKNKGKCPKCGLSLVVGTLNRVEELADQTEENTKNKKVPFKSIVPLPEIIASAFGCGVRTKKVDAEYMKLIEAVGNEFYILLDAELSQIQKHADPLVAEGIKRVRDGNVHISPGYDGEFGVIDVFTEAERKQRMPQQNKLFIG